MSGHIPVLRDEVVQAFDGLKMKTFFDGTLGAGGHAKAILEAHPEIERYIGCDRDPTALGIAKETLVPWARKLELVRGSYSDIERYLDERGIEQIDGFLIDIGVSSMQLDEKDRGFSFRFEGPLDMRMDPDSDLTAEQIVNEYSAKELEKIFREYGEEPQARRAADAIVTARKKKRIETTAALIDIVKPVLKWGKLHPATLIFQALRIVVNNELGELKRGLSGAIKRISPGGRLAVISFHSLEDRIVKHRFKEDVGTKRERGILEILTKKPLVPMEEECKSNPRARSAKLRVAQRRQIV